MKIRSGVLWLLLSLNAGQILHGQTGNTFSLKTSPLSLLIHSPRFGAEFRWSESSAIDMEAGWFFPVNVTYGEPYNDKNKGYIARIEYRFYTGGDEGLNSTEENYFGFELFYKHQSYDISDTSVSSSYTLFSVQKDVECATFRYGATTTFKCGIFLDFSGGIGIRIKEATNSLTDYQNMNMQSTTDYGPNIFLNKAGSFVRPNFDFGLKVGYVFGGR